MPVIASIPTTNAQTGRVERREQEVAVIIAAPAPIHPKIVLGIIAVEHEGVSAALFTKPAVEHRTVGIQLRFHHLFPFGKRISVAGEETGTFIVLHIFLQFPRHILRISSCSVASHRTKIGLQHRGAVAHQRGNRLLGCFRRKHIVLFLHLVPFVGVSQGQSGNKLLMSRRGIAWHHAHTRIGPAMVVHHDSGRRCRAAHVCFLAVDVGTQQVVRSVLVPLCRFQLHNRLCGARCGPFFRQIAASCNGSFSGGTPFRSNLFADALQPRLQVDGQVALRETALERISQHGHYGIIARHNDKAFAVGIAKHIIGRRLAGRAGRHHLVRNQQLQRRKGSTVRQVLSEKRRCQLLRLLHRDIVSQQENRQQAQNKQQ